MRAVYKRELEGYFKSMTGYVFLFFVFLIVGIYYKAYNLNSGYPSMNVTLNSVTFLFLIAIPVLTMRVLSEERRQKTDQLLLTAPVSIEKIVCGKFFALVTVFLIPMAVLCLYPLIMGRFGTVSYVQNYTAILGFTLLGAANIAVGLFISSLTENPIIAAVLTFLVIFLSYIMSGLESFLPSSMSDGIVMKVMEACNIDGHFQSFITGTFDLTAIVYFLSVMFVFVFLTIQNIKKRRWS
ncbi:MAG: ABC transporter permease [Lachnospiraceae bacterium]|nr:ABC transporter permease [Lachnospiraceae bacterium]